MNTTVKFFADSAKNYSEAAERLKSLPPLPEDVWGRVLQAWNDGGLLGLGRNPDGGIRSWANVCGHQITVAAAGFYIAEKLHEPLRAEGCTPEMVCEALLVHDARKPHEFLENSRIGVPDFAHCQQQAANDVQFLVDRGFANKVAVISALTNEVGTDRILRREINLSAMVAWYADITVTNTTWESFAERIRKLQERFEPGGYYHHLVQLYRNHFGSASHGEVWWRAGRIVAAEFTKHLGKHDFLGVPFNTLPL